MATKKNTNSATIAVNRKARHDYHIEAKFEAGLVLEGWEVKSIRGGRVQLVDSHVVFRKGEAWLLNAHITPLATASTHIDPDPTRTRKLLLNKRELSKLLGHVQQKGFTVVPLSLYWCRNRVKVEIALCRGKKLFDKRASDKDRDWQRQKERIFRQH